MSTMTLPRPQIAAEPTVISPSKKVTPEELATMPDGESYELVDGDLRGRNVSKLSSFVAARMVRFIGNHCDPENLGWVFGADLGYRCFPTRPNQVRKPDASFIKRERMPAGDIGEGYCEIVPDLVVEVVSPNDLVLDLEQKLREYREIAIPLVWVIHPETRSARIHHPDGTSQLLLADQDLDGEAILPGFRVRLGDLFPADPSSGEIEPLEASTSPA